jgi:acyl carrier protein
VITEKLKAVILRQLHLDDAVITDTTVAPEVPGWDSLSHVRILSAVEEAFGVRFKPLEVLKLKTVGDLQRLVDKKLGSA